MSEPMLDQLAYGGASTWRDMLQNAEPKDDGEGMLAPPWGDAIRRGKQIETSQPDWQSDPAYQDDGPVGQILNFLKELGHDPWVEFADRTEESANNGDMRMRGGRGSVVHSGVPEQQVMRKESLGSMSRALRALANVPSVEVQEKANMLEVLTALVGAEVEMPNRYKVLDDNGEPILFAVESTDCCTRQLKNVCPDMVPWSVDVFYIQNGADEKAFELRRPFSCTCCCFNRPVVELVDATNGQTLGSLKDPFACCNLTFSVRDPDEQDVIYANGGCCQWGLCCPLPCGPCSEVNFPLTDTQSGTAVGHIQKKVPSCCKFLFAGDVDNYRVEFGAVEKPEYKMLLIAMAIFIDFRFFNSTDENNSAANQGIDAILG